MRSAASPLDVAKFYTLDLLNTEHLIFSDQSCDDDWKRHMAFSCDQTKVMCFSPSTLKHTLSFLCKAWECILKPALFITCFLAFVAALLSYFARYRHQAQSKPNRHPLWDKRCSIALLVVKRFHAAPWTHQQRQNIPRAFSLWSAYMQWRLQKSHNSSLKIDIHLCARLLQQAKLWLRFSCFPPHRLAVSQIVLISAAAFPHLAHSLKCTRVMIETCNSNQPHVLEA